MKKITGLTGIMFTLFGLITFASGLVQRDYQLISIGLLAMILGEAIDTSNKF